MSTNERYSNKQTKQTYFERRPDIVKIFDDLDSFLNFCRIELLPFNPGDLYNKHARVWQIYEREVKGTKRPWNNNRHNNNKPGARVHKPRSH